MSWARVPGKCFNASNRTGWDIQIRNAVVQKTRTGKCAKLLKLREVGWMIVKEEGRYRDLLNKVKSYYSGDAGSRAGT